MDGTETVNEASLVVNYNSCHIYMENYCRTILIISKQFIAVSKENYVGKSHNDHVILVIQYARV
jgi:hypothetical protein